MTSCTHTRTLLAADRNEWDAPPLVAHVNGCDECRTVTALLDRTVATLGKIPAPPVSLAASTLERLRQEAGMDTVPAPPEGLADSVMAHVRREAEKSGVQTSTRPPSLRMRHTPTGRVIGLVAAAAAAFVAVASLRAVVAEPTPLLVALAEDTASAGPFDVTVQGTTTVGLSPDAPPEDVEQLIAPTLTLPDPSLSLADRIAALAEAGLGASRDADATVATAQRRLDNTPSDPPVWNANVDDQELAAAVDEVRSRLPELLQDQRSRTAAEIDNLNDLSALTAETMTDLRSGQTTVDDAQSALAAFRAQVGQTAGDLALLEGAVVTPESVVVTAVRSGTHQPNEGLDVDGTTTYSVHTRQGMLVSDPTADTLQLDPAHILDVSQDALVDLFRHTTQTGTNTFTVEPGYLASGSPALSGLDWDGVVQEQNGIIDSIVLKGHSNDVTVDLFIDLDAQ